MNTDDLTNGGGGDADPEATIARFGASLRTSALWERPPNDLVDRVIAQIDALRAGDGHVGAINAGATPAPAELAEAQRHRASTWLWPGLAVAAAAVVAFAAGALLVGGGDDGRSFETVADVELAATELGGDASAEGTVADAGAGYSINIDVAGLPAAPQGQYYEGWLHNEDTGDWVSVGTFHMRNGDGRVVLWSGVRIDEYGELVVTAESEGSADGHGDILLSGRLEQR